MRSLPSADMTGFFRLADFVFGALVEASFGKLVFPRMAANSASSFWIFSESSMAFLNWLTDGLAVDDM